MAKITNNAEGPRGVETADGLTVFIDPGQTVDVDVADGHELYEGLSKGGKAKADASEPGPLDGSIASLVEHIDGVDDADEIQKLIDAETAGKSRSGALDALNARLEALNEG